MAEVEGREKDMQACSGCGRVPPHGDDEHILWCRGCMSYYHPVPLRALNDESPPTAAKAEGGHPEYLKLLDELREIHVLKSGGYGTTDDPFANFTSIKELTGQPAFLYPMHRTIEKLTRCISLEQQGRYGELGEEFLDCASLMLCAEALRREG